MSAEMNRREFLKQMGKFGLAGAGLLMGMSILNSCRYPFQREKVADDSGHEEERFMAFSNKSLGYYFFIVQQEAVNRAAEAYGWHFKASIADFDPVKQTRHFNQFVRQKPVAIIMDPIDSEGLSSSLKKAKLAGIPVGVIDTPITVPTDQVVLTVAFDNYKGGVMAAEKIVQLLRKKYGEARGTVLNGYGVMSSYAWRLRKKGFETVISQYPNITCISKGTEGDLAKTHAVTMEVLTEYKHLDAVHSPSETPARGIYQALEETGRLHPVGSPKHVIFVTIDGEPLAHQWIKEGILDASISQDPIAYGEICVELLAKYIIPGKQIPGETYSNSRYYWEKAKIVKSGSSTNIIIPPFEINQHNINDRRLWGNIAFNDWGLKYL